MGVVEYDRDRLHISIDSTIRFGQDYTPCVSSRCPGYSSTKEWLYVIDFKQWHCPSANDLFIVTDPLLSVLAWIHMPIIYIKGPIRFNGDKSTPTHCLPRTIKLAVVGDFIVRGHVLTLLVILHANGRCLSAVSVGWWCTYSHSLFAITLFSNFRSIPFWLALYRPPYGKAPSDGWQLSWW